MVTLYGIRNCDTIRKARRWLESNEVDYRFHDFRTDGIDTDILEPWIGELGWEPLLNRRGTTWRKLPEDERNCMNETRAIRLMLSQPAIIKRPVLDTGRLRHIGFSEADYAALLAG